MRVKSSKESKYSVRGKGLRKSARKVTFTVWTEKKEL